ncbi:MAG: amidase family protein, partial [Candidatus Hodarchaeales archaeon]
MNSEEIINLTATELTQKIRKREVSVQEVVETYIKRIKVVDKQLNAVCIPLFEEARSLAIKADMDIAKGKPVGPLHGVPITIKEQFAVAGTETNLGVPNQRREKINKDGPLVARLR